MIKEIAIQNRIKLIIGEWIILHNRIRADGGFLMKLFVPHLRCEKLWLERIRYRLVHFPQNLLFFTGQRFGGENPQFVFGIAFQLVK